MGENTFRRTDEIRTASRLEQPDQQWSRRPARQSQTSHTEVGAGGEKREKRKASEALDGTSFAKFFSGLGWGQAGAVLLVLGVPRHNGHSPRDPMNPSNQTQAPIGCVRTDDPRTNVIQTHRPCQQALCKRSIVWIGRREQKQER